MSGNRDKSFLGVTASLSGRQWIERLQDVQRGAALAISQQLELPELTGRVLAARGITLEEAGAFLDPTIRNLMPNPDELTDMGAATDRLMDAIAGQEKIAIFGDYDVDGACSAALLSRFLDHYGVENEIYVPDRIFEGYGPNPDAIQKLIDNGAKLIVTVDCGSTSFEALEKAAESNVDVVVLDHHQLGTELPVCRALVNPNRQDDLSGLTNLCAAGVVFMTLVSLVRGLRDRSTEGRENAHPELLDWLDLVALATVCDVVPLTGLNRAFVVKGLQVMRRQRNLGLRELMHVSRLDGPPTPYHLGFVLGPRINAGGRIGDAALGARLLTTDDQATAAEISQQLDNLNTERQKAEARMLEEAIAEADAETAGAASPSVIVTASDQWHPGIVGLLASRLKDRFRRPAFAIAFDRHNVGSGSGRSIPGVDLGATVRAALAQGILEKGGGHAMAAGITVERSRLAELRGFFEEKLKHSIQEMGEKEHLKIDGALTARGATEDLLDVLEKAGPYGQGHSQPVFALPAHHVRQARVVGQDHVSFTASAGDGARLQSIAFRSADTELGRHLLSGGSGPVHLAGTLNANFWRGSKRIQFRLIDAAIPQ